jgi:hypothetical protein
MRLKFLAPALTFALLLTASPAISTPFPKAGLTMRTFSLCTAKGAWDFMETELRVAQVTNSEELKAQRAKSNVRRAVLETRGECVFIGGTVAPFRIRIVQPLTYYIPRNGQPKAIAAVEVKVIEVRDGRYANWLGASAATFIYLEDILYDGMRLEFIDHWPPNVPAS